MKLKTPLLQSQSMDAHVHQEFYYKNLEHNQNLRLFLNTNKEKVNKKNRLLKLKEEQEKILQDKVISMSIRPAVKGDDGQSFAEKRILPFFSVPVILKKISDKKKYKNFNLLNPQKKLIYKIIRLNKRLEKLVKSINKYNLNLNSFKGSKLDFILFLRNNLYFNLKIRFSNIFYKIDLIKATYNSIINSNSSNSNSNNSIKLSPLEMLDKLIASSDKTSNSKTKKSSTKNNKKAVTVSSNINKNKKNKGISMAVSPSHSLTQASSAPAPTRKSRTLRKNLLNKTFLDNIVTILNNYSKIMKNNSLISSSLSRNDKSGVATKDINHLFISGMMLSRININSEGASMQANKESEIKYLLFKLNNLIKKIEYIINIININETFLKKIEKINSGRANTINSINNEINNSNLQNTTIYRKEKDLLSLVPNNNKTDLYSQISNWVKSEDDLLNNTLSNPCRENIIKIEKTIKTITNNENNYFASTLPSVFKEVGTSAQAQPLQDKGIITKKFNWKTDTISVNSNPVNVLYFNNNKNKPIINQYLKSMSIYNMTSNGTIMYFSNIIGYNFYNKNLRPFWSYAAETQNIYKLLYSSFRSMYCLISKPVFIIKSNKIIIQLFYFLLVPRIFKYKKKKKYSVVKKGKRYVFYNKDNKLSNSRMLQKNQAKGRIFNTNFNFKIKFHQKLLKKFIKKKNILKKQQLVKLDRINLINLYPLKFKKLCEILNNFFKKPVEFDLIRLHYPYKDSNILVRLLAFMINKIKIRRITRKLFKNAVIKSIKNNYKIKDKTNIIPAFLTGLTIKVAGRLMKYKVIPRKTVRIVRRGSSSIGKINYNNFAKYTNKNRRGAFTISIKSGQNFF
nr:hypothetical protein [Marasmius tenuissimus]UEX92809.1 hypothetical protein [Marasmius tenuissimus]UEX92890.1 hypothetical protein [Marasmius tenuissimus]